MKLNYTIPPKTDPQGLLKTYITAHPAAYQKHFNDFIHMILKYNSCTLWYDTEPDAAYDKEELYTALADFGMVIVIVTDELLNGQSRAMDVEIPFAIKSDIPVFPIIYGEDLAEKVERVLSENVDFIDLTEMIHFKRYLTVNDEFKLIHDTVGQLLDEKSFAKAYELCKKAISLSELMYQKNEESKNTVLHAKTHIQLGRKLAMVGDITRAQVLYAEGANIIRSHIYPDYIKVEFPPLSDILTTNDLPYFNYDAQADKLLYDTDTSADDMANKILANVYGYMGELEERTGIPRKALLWYDRARRLHDPLGFRALGMLQLYDPVFFFRKTDYQSVKYKYAKITRHEFISKYIKRQRETEELEDILQNIDTRLAAEEGKIPACECKAYRVCAKSSYPSSFEILPLISEAESLRKPLVDGLMERYSILSIIPETFYLYFTKPHKYNKARLLMPNTSVDPYNYILHTDNLPPSTYVKDDGKPSSDNTRQFKKRKKKTSRK